MAKWLVIKHTKTSIEPHNFSQYNIDKIIKYYCEESLKKSMVAFVYKYSDKLDAYIKVGNIVHGAYTSCGSDMFNFYHWINNDNA